MKDPRMAGIWDTAEMLIAMAGDAEAALAVARGMAEDYARGRRRRESVFWQDVAAAVAWLANPQPLIAPAAMPAPGGVVRHRRADPRAGKARKGGATIHRLRFAPGCPRAGARCCA